MRDDTRIGGHSDKFPATRWSAIVAARSDDFDERKRGFETIIATYWKPIYKYTRARWGKANEDAKDLTQEFFVRLMEKGFLDAYDPAKARLRTFLRTCVDGFVANQEKAARRIKRGGDVVIFSLDFDAAESELGLGEPPAPGTMDAAAQQKNSFNPAQAFEKIKSLVGRWQATTAEGKNATLVFDMVSGNTAVLERYWEEGSEQHTNMITLYHLDDDRLMLTHYCSANNQPRMRAEPFSPDTKTLRFQFFDATNLSSPDDGHMYRAVYRFTDADHFTTEWTFWKDQKDAFTEVLHFARVR